MNISVYILASSILGLFIGSFLNVLVLRMHTGLSAMRGRSMCFSCGKTLTARELIPVLSYVLQRGRCRGCQAHISAQYPIVEAITAALYGLVAYLSYIQYGLSMQGVAALVFGFILMALFVAIVVYDIQHQIIPDEYVLALVGVVLLAAPFSLMRDFDGWRTYLDMFVSGVTVALPFVVLWVISKGKWIGLGDGKLAFVFGLLFPFPYAVSALVLAVWAGAVYGLSMIGLRKVLHTKYAFNSAIAFGPFLIAGALYIYIYPVDVLGIMMWHEIVSQSLTVSSSAL